MIRPHPKWNRTMEWSLWQCTPTSRFGNVCACVWEFCFIFSGSFWLYEITSHQHQHQHHIGSKRQMAVTIKAAVHINNNITADKIRSIKCACVCVRVTAASICKCMHNAVRIYGWNLLWILCVSLSMIGYNVCACGRLANVCGSHYLLPSVPMLLLLYLWRATLLSFQLNGFYQDGSDCVEYYATSIPLIPRPAITFGNVSNGINTIKRGVSL